MGDNNLPVSDSDKALPTLGDWLASWLGFQLPKIPMPQTIKNLDKAVGTVLLATTENAVARIKSNTSKTKAKGKIAVDGLFRTEEERRKIGNKTAVVQVAVDELNESNEKDGIQDASKDIEDDWLNTFSRLAEDKTSEELRSLFGKILAGEIRKPGSFSLRTMQFISTLSKDDAHKISYFFSFAFAAQFVPLPRDVNGEIEPGFSARIFMEELGLASAPNALSGLTINFDARPQSKSAFLATGYALIVENNTDDTFKFNFACQALTKPGQEMISIANPPVTSVEFMKTAAQQVFATIQNTKRKELLAGRILVRVVQIMPVKNAWLEGPTIFTASATNGLA